MKDLVSLDINTTEGLSNTFWEQTTTKSRTVADIAGGDMLEGE